MKLTIYLLCGILGITFALAFLYFRCLQRREKRNALPTDSDKFLNVSYQSLLQATDGFSCTNLIGAGGFVSVYKVVLEKGETEIAVKVLNRYRYGAYGSFTAECEALKTIRHCNLVKLMKQMGDHTQLFSQRLSIAINVATALEYLHCHCPTQIVHCDLKPSNGLLDDDMVGHASDFGLLSFLPETSGNQSSSTGLKGTIGYAPPEYGMGHEVWTHGNAHSYGIVLLEMFTAKRPTDKTFQESSNLHNFVKVSLPAQVVEIVDPVLVQENYVNGNQMNASRHFNEDITTTGIKFEEIIVSVLEIGVACSAELPRERMNVTDVVTQMRRIRKKHTEQH